MKSRVAVSEYDGVVELNSIYFPKIHKYKGYAHPAAFVSNINRYSLPLDQEIVGGLKWPDPLTDWLKQGVNRHRATSPPHGFGRRSGSRLGTCQ